MKKMVSVFVCIIAVLCFTPAIHAQNLEEMKIASILYVNSEINQVVNPILHQEKPEIREMYFILKHGQELIMDIAVFTIQRGQ